MIYTPRGVMEYGSSKILIAIHKNIFFVAFIHTNEPPFGWLFSFVWLRDRLPNPRGASRRVRMLRPKIGKLACQAQGVSITKRSGVIP